MEPINCPFCGMFCEYRETITDAGPSKSEVADVFYCPGCDNLFLDEYITGDDDWPDWSGDDEDQDWPPVPEPA